MTEVLNCQLKRLCNFYPHTFGLFLSAFSYFILTITPITYVIVTGLTHCFLFVLKLNLLNNNIATIKFICHMHNVHILTNALARYKIYHNQYKLKSLWNMVSVISCKLPLFNCDFIFVSLVAVAVVVLVRLFDSFLVIVLFFCTNIILLICFIQIAFPVEFSHTIFA